MQGFYKHDKDISTSAILRIKFKKIKMTILSSGWKTVAQKKALNIKCFKMACEKYNTFEHSFKKISETIILDFSPRRLGWVYTFW